MKKTIVLLGMLLLSIFTVTAGSIEDLDYKDKVLFWDLNRQVDDYSVTIDADTLGGSNASTFYTYVDSRTSGGFGKWDMIQYLFNEYVEWLNEVYFYTIYGRLEQCEAYNYDNQNRIFMLQERVQALEEGS